MAIEWFERFGAIPGVKYSAPAGIDRSKVPRAQERPRVDRYNFDGEVHESLRWETPSGSSSASPAHERAFGSDQKEFSTVELLQFVRETLELPGEPSDYHFAIQGAADELWRRRRSDPSVYAHVEFLGRLDLQLIRARPQTIAYDRDGETAYYQVSAFARLTTLYEREGAFQDALEIAQEAATRGQGDSGEALLERMAAAEEEAVS